MAQEPKNENKSVVPKLINNPNIKRITNPQIDEGNDSSDSGDGNSVNTANASHTSSSNHSTSEQQDSDVEHETDAKNNENSSVEGKSFTLVKTLPTRDI